MRHERDEATGRPTYDELFQRNIGIFTLEEQRRIRGLCVSIAGCGGLGGPVAYSLARLGVGELRLADPELFEPSNINRQHAAYIDTVGVNKATAVAAELARINPDLAVHVWTDGVTPDTVDGFIDGADCVVDGLEFFALETELLLHQKARGGASGCSRVKRPAR